LGVIVAKTVWAGSWIAAKYADRKIAFLHDKSAYGRGLADQVKAHMNAGGVKEILFEGVNPGEKDYTAVIGKLKTLHAEVVYYGGYPTEGGLIMRQAADQGFKFQMVGTSGFVTPVFWSIAGSAGEGFHLLSRPSGCPRFELINRMNARGGASVHFDSLG
jgi:branched-chain amino acid transport system substrate-binding protein